MTDSSNTHLPSHPQHHMNNNPEQMTVSCVLRPEGSPAIVCYATDSHGELFSATDGSPHQSTRTHLQAVCHASVLSLPAQSVWGGMKEWEGSPCLMPSANNVISLYKHAG